MTSAARSGDYSPHPPPPPGQGYYQSYPRSERRNNYQQQQQPYFDPPPTDAYPDSQDGEHMPYHYNPPPPPQPPQSSSSPLPAGRGRKDSNGHYADGERDRAYGEHETEAGGGALTPYDDEKAEAEWRRGVEEAYARQPSGTRRDDGYGYSYGYDARDPPSAEEFERGEERARQRERYHTEKQREWEEEDLREEEEERRRRRRREREREEAQRERAPRFASDPKKGGRDVFGGSEGERGLAASLAGGAGGAWIAHEVGDSALGTLSGLVVGAIAGGVLEKQWEKMQANKERERHGREYPFPQPGRDMDDVRRTGRDGRAPRRDIGPRDRPDKRGGSSFGDKLRRSLSRVRSRSRPRRSASEDSHYR